MVKISLKICFSVDHVRRGSKNNNSCGNSSLIIDGSWSNKNIHNGAACWGSSVVCDSKSGDNNVNSDDGGGNLGSSGGRSRDNGGSNDGGDVPVAVMMMMTGRTIVKASEMWFSKTEN